MNETWSGWKVKRGEQKSCSRFSFPNAAEREVEVVHKVAWRFDTPRGLTAVAGR